MEKKVGITILTCNQKKLLEETLDSLFKKTNYKNYRVYAVDNGSKDRHDLMIKEKFPKVKVIRNKRNLGFSKANNQGMKASYKDYNPDYFLLLNDDLEFIEKDWLKKMVDFAEKNKKVGILGCQLIYPDKRMQDVGGYLKRWELTKVLKFKQGDALDVDHFMGACILVKKEVIAKIGGLDEIYSPFLLEDSDFCLRAKKHGYKIMVLTNVKIIHKKSKTVEDFSNHKKLFVRFKNDMIFSMRHLRKKDALFRIFIYLPLVAVLRKKKDEEKLTKIKNLKIRKEFLINIFLLIGAYFYTLISLRRILKKEINKIII